MLGVRFHTGSNAGIYCPTFDGNGNVSEYINNSNGSVVAHYEYGPFGELTATSGSMAGAFKHRFSTKPLDVSTGYYYYTYRYYDPVTGRWLSRDPIGEEGGANLYGFIGNDGNNKIDLLGSDPFTVTAPGLAKAIADSEPIDMFFDDEENEMSDVTGWWDAGKVKHAMKAADACLKYTQSNYEKNDKGEYGVERLRLSDGWGGQADAVRHCVWTCEMTKSLGSAKALKVTELHEKHHPPKPRGNSPPKGYSSIDEWKAADVKMDVTNNNIGLSIANTDKCADCCKSCRTLLNDGKLQVNQPGGYDWSKPRSGPSMR